MQKKTCLMVDSLISTQIYIMIPEYLTQQSTNIFSTLRQWLLQNNFTSFSAETRFN